MVNRKRKNNRKLTLSKVNKKLNNLIGSVEIKQCLSAYQTSVTQTPIFYDFNIPTIAQGTGEQERVGEKIHLTKLQTKIQLQIGNSGISPNDSHNQVRLMVILYQAIQGAHPTMDDIMQSPSTGNSIMFMNSLYKKNPAFKYRVLYDKLHNLYWTNNSGATGGAPKVKNINIVRKINQEIHFDGQALPTGWLPCLLIASDSGAATHPEFSFNARLSYKDL